MNNNNKSGPCLTLLLRKILRLCLCSTWRRSKIKGVSVNGRKIAVRLYPWAATRRAF